MKFKIIKVLIIGGIAMIIIACAEPESNMEVYAAEISEESAYFGTENLEETSHPYKKTVLADNEYFTIETTGKDISTEDELRVELSLTNKTGDVLCFSGKTFAVNGVAVNGSLYTFVDENSTEYGYISISKEDLNAGGILEPVQITFDFSVTDTENQDAGYYGTLSYDTVTANLYDEAEVFEYPEVNKEDILYEDANLLIAAALNTETTIIVKNNTGHNICVSYDSGDSYLYMPADTYGYLSVEPDEALQIDVFCCEENGFSDYADEIYLDRIEVML